jgi:exodeoxyribonuclease V alpha subunit
MTVHISARVAWHDSGWNGRICQDPKAMSPVRWHTP